MSENVEKRFAFLAKYDKLECGVVGLLITELETFYYNKYNEEKGRDV